MKGEKCNDREMQCDDSSLDLPRKPSKGILDSFQEKLISRKLLVFITATVLLSMAELDPETWGLIAMCYIGGQSVIDTIKAYKHGDTIL